MLAFASPASRDAGKHEFAGAQAMFFSQAYDAAVFTGTPTKDGTSRESRAARDARRRSPLTTIGHDCREEVDDGHAHSATIFELVATLHDFIAMLRATLIAAWRWLLYAE